MGVKGTPLHNVWHLMMLRCNNPNATSYEYYGGRGISVCARWHNFQNFAADVGPRPDGLTLDRIDNDSNYEPSNCRWATWEQQNRNSRNTKLTDSAVAEIRALRNVVMGRDLAKRFGVSRAQISRILTGKRWAVSSDLRK